MIELSGTAIKAGDLAAVKASIDAGADLDAKLKDDFRVPLFLAYDSDQYDIFSLLIKHGANINITNGSSDTLLNRAIFDGRNEYAKLLIHSGVDVDVEGYNGNYPLIEAYERKQFELVLDIIDKSKKLDATFEYEKHTLLSKASKEGKIDIVKALIEKNADVNVLDYQGYNAIYKAVDGGHYDVAALLLEKTIDLNIKNKIYDEPLLVKAIKDKQFSFAISLIEHGANPNIEDSYKDPVWHLLFESENLNKDLLLAFIASGLDVNNMRRNGETLLHAACKKGDEALVNFLLVNGANPMVLNHKGESPIDLIPFDKKEKISSIIKKECPDIEQISDRDLKIAKAYASSLSTMSKMIILGGETKEEPKGKLLGDMQVIYNNVGYDIPDMTNKPKHVELIKGQPLSFVMPGCYPNPIGYNIFIPKGLKQIDKVIVSAYGGFTKTDHKYKSTPLKPFRRAIELMHEGCVVIELNLPDFLHNVNQHQMFAALHIAIHSGINHFFETITNEPEQLSTVLKEMKIDQADIYLSGASFGGRTAARHAQLYPHTFKGYICHDGAFSNRRDMRIVSSVDRKFEYEQTLLPVHHVYSTQDPILILQNRDDNNVNIETALEFYNELVDAGKEDLVRLCFFEKGNPVPKEQGIHNKGHFIPFMERERYMNAMLNFMTYGPTALPQIHKTFMLRQQHLAEQFFRRDNDEARFLALAAQKYLDNPEHHIVYKNQDDAWDKLWQNDYLPMMQALGEIRKMITDQAYFTQTIEQMKASDSLTDDVIINAIKNHAPMFREYYKESNHFEDVSIDEICSNKRIVSTYRGFLLTINASSLDDFSRFLLENLFFANPQLLPKLESSQAWDDVKLARMNKTCKKRFQAQMDDQKKATISAWQAAVQLVLKKHKTQTEALQKELTADDVQTNEKVYQQLFLTDTFFVGDEEASLATLNVHQQRVVELVKLENQKIMTELEAQSQTDEFQEVLSIMTKVSSASKSSLEAKELKLIQERLKTAPKNEALIRLISNLLMIDKLQHPLHHEGIIVGLIRESLILDCLQAQGVHYQAHEKMIAQVRQIFPALNRSSILSLVETLNHGLNDLDESGNYPLHRAIKAGNDNLASCLLELGADFTKNSQEGLSTIELACESMGLPFISKLVGMDVQLSPKCFEIACKKQAPEVIQYLIEFGAHPFGHARDDAPPDITKHPSFITLMTRAREDKKYELMPILKSFAKAHHFLNQFDEILLLNSRCIFGEMPEDELLTAIDQNKIDLHAKDIQKRTLLINAVRHQQPKVIQKLIERGVEIDSVDKQNCNAMYYALRKDEMNLAELIVDSCPEIECERKDVNLIESFLSKYPPFALDSKKDQISFSSDKVTKKNFDSILKYALEKKKIGACIDIIMQVVDSEIISGYSKSLLHHAIENKAYGVAEILIKKGANVNATNQTYNDCLAMALLGHNPKLALLLIEHGANPNGMNKYRRKHLDIAINASYEDVTLALLEHGAHLNEPDYYTMDEIFERALTHKLFKVTKLMVDTGYDINSRDWCHSTPLIRACKNMGIEMAMQVIALGADVNVKDNNGYVPIVSAIERAFTPEELNLARAILEKHPNLNVQGSRGASPLWVALEKGFYDFAFELIEHGANIDDVDPRDYLRGTPLMWAIEKGDTALALKLLEKGADVNFESNRNITPLLCAVNRGNIELVRVLIQKGANLDVCNHLKETPLHIASKFGNKELVEILVKAGASINPKNFRDETPVGEAMRAGHLETSILLIDSGADITIKNNLNMPAIKLTSDSFQSAIQSHIESSQPKVKDRPRKKAVLYSTQEDRERTPKPPSPQNTTEEEPEADNHIKKPPPGKN